jgi:transketolase
MSVSKARKPLEMTIKLHDAPSVKPLYSTQITSRSGEAITLADPKMNRVLVALMDHAAVNGGAASHWGGPAALAEAMSAIHAIMFKNEKWQNNFNFINDVGHAENGIYALRANLGYGSLKIADLKGFRSIESKLTGHGECHLYPEGVLLSNGPLGSSVGQAQGLAMADKLSGNKRVTINIVSDGASMEGEAKEAFAAIAGFAKKEMINPYLLVISDNNTKLSGRIDADSFSMDPSFNAMKELGWNVITIEKGNDLQACYHGFEEALEKLANGSKPICLRLKTVKGFGVKSTEESTSGGHGFPIKPFAANIVEFVEEIYGADLPKEIIDWTKELTIAPAKSDSTSAVKKEKAQAGFSRAAIQAVEAGYPLISISSDLQGSTGMAAFQKAYPSHAIDVGIAESNMVSVGAGFSKQGYIPVVDTFAAFGVTKGNLPLIMASLSNAPVICVFSHTGFQDAADGASHQSLTYLSAVSSIPNTDVVVVSSSEEAQSLFFQAVEKFAKDLKAGSTPKSTVFFVGRENFPAYNKEGLIYEWNKSQVIRQGSDGVIVACGPQVQKALLAAEELAKTGKSLTVINRAFINTGDVDLIASELDRNGNILITIEDHQIIGGMASQLVHSLKLIGSEFKLKSLAVKNKFGQSAYTADQLYALHKTDDQAIVEAFKAL